MTFMHCKLGIMFEDTIKIRNEVSRISLRESIVTRTTELAKIKDLSRLRNLCQQF